MTIDCFEAPYIRNSLCDKRKNRREMRKEEMHEENEGLMALYRK